MLGLKFGIFLVFAIICSSIISHVYSDGIFVEFDKNTYKTGDMLSISGQVSEVKMPVIAMSIYDPDEKILSANNIELDSDGLFVKKIILNSPFYEKSGKYVIKLNYGKAFHTDSFVISNQNDSTKVTIDSSPKITSLHTDKQQYTNNDIITINGSVSTTNAPTVLIGIYDPHGAPAGFYFGTINSKLEFTSSFLAKSGVNFKMDGIYTIKAHYAESSKTISFTFVSMSSNDVIDNDKSENESSSSNQNNNQSTQNTSNTQSTQNTSNTQSTQNTSNTQSTQNTSNTQSTQNTSNTQSTQNTSNTQSTQNTSNTQSTQNTSIVDQTSNSNQFTSTNSDTSHNSQNKKSKNLTVEDIELGLILNQINLNCDSSKYADIINYYDGMGPALYRLCKFENSLSFFDDGLAKNPRNIDLLVNKGSALGKLGHYYESIIYYDRALQIDSEFIPAMNNKANAYANLGEYDKAKSLYEHVILKDPKNIIARKNLSILLDDFLAPTSSSIDKDNFLSNPQLNEKQVNNMKEVIESVIIHEKESEKNHQETSVTFLDELSSAFSSLSSLFGLLK